MEGETEELGLVDYCKKGWILLQGTIMTYYLVSAIRKYSRVDPGWCTLRNILFVLQAFTVLRVFMFEFVANYGKGLFTIWSLSTFGSFLTFIIVCDSINDDKEEMHWLDFVHRIVFAYINGYLFLSGSLFLPPCTEDIYPWHFLAITGVIILQLVWRCFARSKSYFKNFDRL